MRVEIGSKLRNRARLTLQSTHTLACVYSLLVVHMNTACNLMSAERQ